jgi:hypothetical protein
MTRQIPRAGRPNKNQKTDQEILVDFQKRLIKQQE